MPSSAASAAASAAAQVRGKEELIESPSTSAPIASQDFPGLVGTNAENLKRAEANIRAAAKDEDKYVRLDLSNLNLTSLPSFEMIGNLTELDCSNNPLRTVDLGSLSSLCTLAVRNCDLEKGGLVVDRCPELRALYCETNRFLGELDLSANTKLNSLDASSTGLSVLPDIPLANIGVLYVRDNDLMSLDLRGASSLRSVWVDGNTNMEHLELGQCTKLRRIGCQRTKIKSLDLWDSNVRMIMCESDTVIRGLVGNVDVHVPVDAATAARDTAARTSAAREAEAVRDVAKLHTASGLREF